MANVFDVAAYNKPNRRSSITYLFSSCVDTPVGASVFFDPVRAGRSSAVMRPDSGCGLDAVAFAAGLSGGTRIGAKSFDAGTR